MANPNERESAGVGSVAVKLPDFWKNDPAMWFAQAEAQFMLAGVSRDETKFYHIIAKVDQSVLCHISDLVANPPTDNKYQAIKTRLLQRFELSEQAKLEKLLNSCDLGDMKPTHLLARMMDLASGLNVDDGLMKMLFLQRLPTNVKTVLSISDGTLTKLAEMADKMMDSSYPQVAATQQSSPSGGITGIAEDVQNQIAMLTAEIRKLKASQQMRSRSASRTRNNSTSEICWYHRKYGARAQQCREPCTFSSGTKN